MAQAIIAASAQQDKAQLTMSSLEISELTGKEHKNVIRDIRIMLDELKKDGSDLSHVREDKDARGYTAMFHLNRELTDTLLTGYSIPLRRKVIARWHELEAKAAQPQPTVALPQDYITALEYLLESKKAEQLAIAERDHAIATKAQIGHQREATAMATASVAVRQVESLKTKLDESQQWATIKRMEMAYHGQKFDWRLLKAASTDLGLKTKPVFDANYGTVNAYHADAWLEAYAIEIL